MLLEDGWVVVVLMVGKHISMVVVTVGGGTCWCGLAERPGAWSLEGMRGRP